MHAAPSLDIGGPCMLLPMLFDEAVKSVAAYGTAQGTDVQEPQLVVGNLSTPARCFQQIQRV